MLEARLTWSSGTLYVNADATLVDWEPVRTHLDAAARLLGADAVALELVITSEKPARPERQRQRRPELPSPGPA